MSLGDEKMLFTVCLYFSRFFCPAEELYIFSVAGLFQINLDSGHLLTFNCIFFSMGVFISIMWCEIKAKVMFILSLLSD